jgi:hypothetical protein
MNLSLTSLCVTVHIIIVDTIKDNIEIKKPNIYVEMVKIMEENRKELMKRDGRWF